MDAEKEALEGRDPDKKSKVFLLILLFAPSLLLLGVFAIILIICINSSFSPQNKANNFLNVNVSSDFSNENNVENLFNSILNLDSNSLKGNYYNSNAIESTEFMFYRQLYESKYFPITCFNKEKATAMIIATLFYNGDFNSSLNYNDQDYLLHNSKYDPKKGPEDSSDNFENRLKELMSFFDNDSEVATKETKKLYKYACKGYESYQQYLVDTYIPNNATDFSLNVPKNDASKSEKDDYENEIALIGEEIVFSADNYLRLNGSYLIDYETYKIKMPRSNYYNLEGGVPIILGNNCTLKEETWKELVNPLGNGYCQINSCYGVYGGGWGCKIHNGGSIDIANGNANTPIYAIAGGVVTSIYNIGTGSCYDNKTGKCSNCEGELHENYVIIRSEINGDIINHSYFHLSTVSVSEGQTVSTGQQIGNMGNTGCSAGAHLDFRFSDGNSQSCNPLELMKLTNCDLEGINDCSNTLAACRA